MKMCSYFNERWPWMWNGRNMWNGLQREVVQGCLWNGPWMCNYHECEIAMNVKLPWMWNCHECVITMNVKLPWMWNYHECEIAMNVKLPWMWNPKQLKWNGTITNRQRILDKLYCVIFDIVLGRGFIKWGHVIVNPTVWNRSITT